MTPESILKREICDYLARFPRSFTFTLTPGVTANKKAKRSKYMPAGWPDITGFWRKNYQGGGFMVVPFFIETKIRPKGPSKEQAEFLAHASSWGCVAILAYELKDVVEVFHGYQAKEN